MQQQTLSGFEKLGKAARGAGPAGETALRLYACSQGTYAWRRVARTCEECIVCVAVTWLDRLDFPALRDFRKWRVAAVQGLFLQPRKASQLARPMRLGHMALYGAKMREMVWKVRQLSDGRSHDAGVRLGHEVCGIILCTTQARPS